MRKIKFLLMTVFCAIFTLQVTSCSSDDDGSNDGDGGTTGTVATGISVDKTTLSLEEGDTTTLVALVKPLGADGSVTWSSSDSSIATVDSDGVVTAVKKGTANIAASIGAFTSICAVTVTEVAIVLDDTTLEGSNYYVIQLDDASFASISNKVVHDFRPDDTNVNLYIWDATFTAGSSVGTNFYGLDAGWVSLVVANVGWSGAGFSVNTGYGDIDMTALAANPEDYYLHVGVKTGQSNSSFLIIVADGSTEVKVAIGGDFTDSGITYPKYADITRDNKWNSIEIPVTHLNQLGLFYDATFQNKNVMSFLAGGTSGTTFDLDAAFFYKKAQ